MGNARSLCKSGKGRPSPQGCSEGDGGKVNFVLTAPHSNSVWLLLQLPQGHPGWEAAGATENACEMYLKLDPAKNKTETTWHIEVAQEAFPAKGVKYAWLLDPPLDGKGQPVRSAKKVIDPYAKELDSPPASKWNVRGPDRYSPMAVVPDRKAVKDFDWQGVKSPGYHLRELIIYEAHVRGFTRNPDSGLEQWDTHAGTFLGFVEKIPHLLKLGINCVEFLPVFEFDETACPRRNPHNGEMLCNYWGYSTVSFFVPMQRFAAIERTSAAIVGFKTLVRELHRVGIEVLLDVVFNHTAEGTWGENNWHSWKGISHCHYYLLSKGHDTNYTGCGNTMNANDPLCTAWIVECLKYWALDMHVDGFRFDLASTLCRGADGKVCAEPPVIKAMSTDPDLKHVKLIAEPWDCSWPDGYLVGRFPSCGPPRWAEWNGKFRDTVRCFLKGDEGMKGEFASRVCGSSDLFKHNGRGPCHSINFITAHDGFTLRDLVSYNGKQNACNGENSGDDHNNSWNCGAEGPTGDGGINHLRERQLRNFLVALFLSTGTPMIVFGDEYGRSQRGCNNGWCQDALSWFSWSDCAKEDNKLVRFTSLLIAMRKRYMHIFGREGFMSDKDIWWRVYWDDPYNYICYILHDHQAQGGYAGLLIAFNGGHQHRECDLPGGKQWYRLIDTNLAPPKDFCDDEKTATRIDSPSYGMHPYSCIVLKCMHDKEEGFSYADTEQGYSQQQKVAEHLREVVRRRMSMELLPDLEPEQVRLESMRKRMSFMSGMLMELPDEEDEVKTQEVSYVIARLPSSSLLPMSASRCFLPGMDSVFSTTSLPPPDAAPAAAPALAATAAAALAAAPPAVATVAAAVPGASGVGLGVRFRVECRATNPGEAVYIAGSAPAVGAWDPAQALRCATNAATFPVWTSEPVLFPPSTPRLEFKLVVGPEASVGGKRWEGGGNRIVELPASIGAGQVFEISCVWGTAEVQTKTA